VHFRIMHERITPTYYNTVLVYFMLLIVSYFSANLLVRGQVTIIFVVSVCLSVCLFLRSFSQPSLIRFRSN